MADITVQSAGIFVLLLAGIFFAYPHWNLFQRIGSPNDEAQAILTRELRPEEVQRAFRRGGFCLIIGSVISFIGLWITIPWPF